MPAHLVVVCGVVDVLNRHHPHAKQQPQRRGDQVDHRDKAQDQQTNGARQKVAQLAHLAAEGAWHHGSQFGQAEGRKIILPAHHHFDLLRKKTVKRRGNDIGQQGEGEKHHQQYQHDKQWPQHVFKKAQPTRQAGHKGLDPATELLHGEHNQCSKQDQVDRQRQQHKQPQAGAKDQFQAFAEVLRAGQHGGVHGRSLQEVEVAPTLPALCGR